MDGSAGQVGNKLRRVVIEIEHIDGDELVAAVGVVSALRIRSGNTDGTVQTGHTFILNERSLR